MTPHNHESTARAVILTALELEHSAVTRYLSGPPAERTERGLIFDVGSFAGRRPWTIAVAQAGPGNPGAGIMLERAVAAFRPNVAMFVGIAGGRKDVRHGDVVVADAVYDYESGKAANDDYLPRIKTFAPSFELVQHARAVARADRWPDLVQPRIPPRRPSALVKPIAAGGKVVAGGRSAMAEFLTHNCGDAVAVDMESYGFLHGAYVNHEVAALVVRGISDLLDDKTLDNDQAWQIPAARHAAAFAFAVLARLDPDDSPRLPSTAGAQAPPTAGAGQYTQIIRPAAGGTVFANQGTGNQVIHNERRSGSK